MTTQFSLENNINKSFKTMITIGLLIAALGFIAVIYPQGFGKISVMAIGLIVLLGGIFRIVFAAATFSMGSLIMRYLYGILMSIAGIWIMMNPEMGLEALTFVMAIYFIIDGVTAAIYSFSLMPIGGGLYLLLSGILSIAIGVLIFSNWTEASNYILGLYVGVKLIVDGLMLALTGKALKNSIKLNN